MAVTNINNVFHLKVTIEWAGKTRGNPYRTIAIPQNASLYNLAEAIIDSFDFDFDHAFGFYNNLKDWYRSIVGYELFTDIGEGSKFPGVKKTRLLKVFTELKTKMLFMFDYGDEWCFIVQLVKITDFDKNIKYPVITDSFGDAPPQYDYNDEDYDDDDFDDDEIDYDNEKKPQK
ncbi:MAG: hypothetical protein V1874_05680 [Spirochaetota bacterium]